ncbi:hypothetical protein BpHYR1_016662 [Brachionus plicatilis]|uniref:Uncharacterized protein n=1 Tax=Brachionus plicatilis TaxID=10195 RepID=A0A3M7QC83_BRAPC|nr:hypothetical protein BpHYR1_016662 [Brachionus plicatilis]
MISRIASDLFQPDFCIVIRYEDLSFINNFKLNKKAITQAENDIAIKIEIQRYGVWSDLRFTL